MFGENDDKNKIVNEIINKRSELESYLKKIEKSIYDCESKYLEGSQFSGNILKGWDQIFTAKPKLAQTQNQPLIKRTKFTNNERIFSQTSYHNSHLKEDNHHSVNINNLRVNISHNIEGNKEGFLRKKLKKKIYSSLSLKKKKVIIGGIHSNQRNIVENTK